MKLYILRHEERPPHNPGFETSLTEFGRHKAMFSLKNTLRSIQFTHVFSSPFPRVLQTIAPFARNNHDVSIEYGLAEGLTDPVFMSATDFAVVDPPCSLTGRKSAVDPNDYKFPESDERIRTRAKIFYYGLVADHKDHDHTILLASHKCICNALLELMTGEPRGLEDEYAMGKLATTDADSKIIWAN
jgi:broad specificity phosphatase PhoE